MSPQLAECFKRLAVELDWLKDVQPPGYEANIILRHPTDPAAHIFVGSSDPRQLADAISELIDNPGLVGITNRNGTEIEL